MGLAGRAGLKLQTSASGSRKCKTITSALQVRARGQAGNPAAATMLGSWKFDGTRLSGCRIAQSVQAIWTIGHSTHEPDYFISLLQANAIRFVIDVRSAPNSRVAPHFSRQALQALLKASQISYGFFGTELGGRPAEPELYDDHGRVLYWAVAKLERFQSAIKRLANGSNEYRIAIMCAEENPRGCHRRLLVGRVLAQSGICLRHIRGDGRIDEEQDVDLLPSGPLIGAIPNEEHDWKSIQSVLHKRRPSNFLSVSNRPGHAH